MPGANCAIVNCSTSRRTKNIGIFQLLCNKPGNEKHQKWRNDFLGAVLSTRVKDASLNQQIKNGSIWVCEKHFQENDYEVCKYSYIDILVY